MRGAHSERFGRYVYFALEAREPLSKSRQSMDIRTLGYSVKRGTWKFNDEKNARWPKQDAKIRLMSHAAK